MRPRSSTAPAPRRSCRLTSRPSTMRANRSIPDAAIIPVLNYPDVPAAARWLCNAFGLVERLRIGDHRVQLTFAGGALVAADRGSSASGRAESVERTHSVLVRVADADAHCARARAAGAEIVSAPTDYPYGEPGGVPPRTVDRLGHDLVDTPARGGRGRRRDGAVPPARHRRERCLRPHLASES